MLVNPVDSVQLVGKQIWFKTSDLPCVKFQVKIEGKKDTLVIVFPTYRDAKLRSLLDILDGCSVNQTKWYEHFVAVFKDVTILPETFINTYARSIRIDRQGKKGWFIKPIELSWEDFDLIEQVCLDTGVLAFLDELAEDTLDANKLPFDKDSQEYYLNWEHFRNPSEAKELFERDFKVPISTGGDIPLYPADVLNVGETVLDKVPKRLLVFAGYSTFKSILNSPEISDEQRGLFEQTICKCGSDLVMRSSDKGMTLVSCLNPYCKFKMTIAFADMLVSFGSVGIGSKKLLEAYDWLWRDKILYESVSGLTYSDFLDPENIQYIGGALRDELESTLSTINEYSGSTQELVKQSGLPNIGVFAGEIITRSTKRNITTFSQFYIMCSRHKIKDYGVAYNLFKYVDCLNALINTTKCRDMTDTMKIKICITKSIRLLDKDGKVVPFRNKDDFVQSLNSAIVEEFPNGNVAIVRQNHISSDVTFLIDDQKGDTTKVTQAHNLGIPVITSNQAYQYVMEVLQNG